METKMIMHKNIQEQITRYLLNRNGDGKDRTLTTSIYYKVQGSFMHRHAGVGGTTLAEEYKLSDRSTSP